VLAAISDLGPGLPDGSARPFFSEWLNSLQTSGLRGFRTVLEIRVFRAAYEFPKKGLFGGSSRAGTCFRNRHIEVRFLPPQPAILVFREFPSFDEKGLPNVGFSHRRLSLETDSRTFWAENSQKSLAEFKKTRVFWRLASETEE
jgi:hypothetical protein